MYLISNDRLEQVNIRRIGIVHNKIIFPVKQIDQPVLNYYVHTQKHQIIHCLFQKELGLVLSGLKTLPLL